MQYEERQQLTKPSFNSSTQSLPRGQCTIGLLSKKNLFFIRIYGQLKIVRPLSLIIFKILDSSLIFLF